MKAATKSTPSKARAKTTAAAAAGSTVYRNRSAAAASGSMAGTTDTRFQGSTVGSPSFEFWIFFFMILENWILDFGRPVANFYFRFLPEELPNVGDWFHMAYNVITPFLLLLLMDRTSKPVTPWLKYLIVIVFTLGASLHLVGDAIQSKLVQNCDINLSQKVKDLPVMHALGNKHIMHIFEMTYFFDEHAGHYLWYLPYFAALMLYYNACFTKAVQKMPLSAWLLQPLGMSFYWYLIVEGQVWPMFIVAYALMAWLWYSARARGEHLDVNGQFMLTLFTGVAVLFVCWLVYMKVPVGCVLKVDLDCVPECWESYPYAYKALVKGEW